MSTLFYFNKAKRITHESAMNFILPNLPYIIIFILSSGMLIYPVIEQFRMGEATDVNGAVALMNREQAILLDVRDADSYAKGSVAQAKNVPADTLASRAADFSKQTCIVLMDADGKNTIKAAAILRTAGAARVVVLNGGYEAWIAAGLPIKKISIST
jgi:rhodanese-related sulfurtransferase